MTARQPAVPITPGRMLADLKGLSAIGARLDGRGIDRVAGSDADRAARSWVAARMEEAGLVVEETTIGNVVGRPPGPPPWLLLGSHTDTVPMGGPLDGAYGLVAALEVARALRHPRLAVVDFWDEEGVAGGGLAGSKDLCASPLIASFGAYLELHIEQGPRLEAMKMNLGVVETIVGIDRFDATFQGLRNHAGTTPMNARRDAGAAAGRIMADFRRTVAALDPDAVGNIGWVELVPGVPNVVPGEARLVIELRSASTSVLDRGWSAIAAAGNLAGAEFGCSFEVVKRARIQPVRMDPLIVEIVEAACQSSGGSFTRLASGAGHDAGVMALSIPAGMLFVPSRGGISHSPLEHTDDADLILGAETLAEASVHVLARIEGWQGSARRFNSQEINLPSHR